MLFQKTGWVCSPVFLNGFPKSGLHAFELMAQRVVKPHVPFGERGPWITILQDRNFSLKRVPKMKLRHMRMAQVPMTRYVKGHNPYDEDLERLQYMAGHALVVIMRDLRDVAVSQAHHMRHLAERWRAFEPWLSCEWAHAVRFEDLIQRPKTVAAELFRYIVARTAQSIETDLKIDKQGMAQTVEDMADGPSHTSLSPTFREGKVGGWCDYFELEHRKASLETGLTDCLVCQGYEEDDDWAVG